MPRRYAEVACTRAANSGLPDVKCRNISLRCACSCRDRRVFTSEMPMPPPMLRSRLYSPLALPISWFGSPAIAVVESGTKTHPDPKPLMMMGQSSVH